jgi:hypothetical protein
MPVTPALPYPDDPNAAVKASRAMARWAAREYREATGTGSAGVAP